MHRSAGVRKRGVRMLLVSWQRRLLRGTWCSPVSFWTAPFLDCKHLPVHFYALHGRIDSLNQSSQVGGCSDQQCALYHQGIRNEISFSQAGGCWTECASMCLSSGFAPMQAFQRHRQLRKLQPPSERRRMNPKRNMKPSAYGGTQLQTLRLVLPLGACPANFMPLCKLTSLVAVQMVPGRP